MTNIRFPQGAYDGGSGVDADEYFRTLPKLQQAIGEAAWTGRPPANVESEGRTWVWRKEKPVIEDQPPPVPNDEVPVWDLVIADMQERDQVGRERYGTPLQANNGRDHLVDAYQEALDLVVYLRAEIERRRRE